MSKSNMEVPVLPVQAVSVGDVLVLACPGNIESEAADRLMSKVKEAFPGNQCILLTSGLRLEVYRRNS